MKRVFVLVVVVATLNLVIRSTFKYWGTCDMSGISRGQ